MTDPVNCPNCGKQTTLYSECRTEGCQYRFSYDGSILPERSGEKQQESEGHAGIEVHVTIIGLGDPRGLGERIGEEVLAAIDEGLHAQEPEGERIRCMGCGKSVSSPVPKGTVVRAATECPECIESSPVYRDHEAMEKLRESGDWFFWNGCIHQVTNKVDYPGKWYKDPVDAILGKQDD